MKSILLLTILVFAICNRDLLVELEAKAKPVPIIKCLIASETIRKDIVEVVEAVKKFVEDKNGFALINKLLTIYPEVDAEVKRCLKEKEVNLTSFVNRLPKTLLQIWSKIPAKVRQQIMQALQTKGNQFAKDLCYRLLKTRQQKQICGYI